MEINEPAHPEVNLYLVFGILTLLATVSSVFNYLNCCFKRESNRNEPKEYPLVSVRVDSDEKQEESLLTVRTDGEHESGPGTTQGIQYEDEASMEWKKQKLEEKLRREEERQKLEEKLGREEERQKLEERLGREEERQKLEEKLGREEERQKLEERLGREEERQKLEEKLGREEEERQKLEEKLGREEEERQKLEEKLGREEEERQKLEEKLGREEEERQKLEEKLGREEKERQKLEEKLGREEERQKLEEKLGREEEERQKLEEKLGREEEERQKLEEKLGREEEERQKLEEKLKTTEEERQKLEEKLRREEVQKPKGNIGLRNQGATCYLNSLLQTLFMTQDFRNTVERLFKPIDVHIAQLFMDLKSGKRVATTERITPELEINVYEQQDAAEYFQKIMNMVNPEMAKVYQGEFKHKTMCKNPGKEHPLVTRHESFYIIPICMETNGTDSPINMQSCFDSYFEPIKTCEDDQVKCPTCKEMVNTEIKCDIHKLPPVLVVQLERFQLDYYTMRYKKNKSTVEIQFQLSVKDDSGAQHQYDLYAVVKHTGSFDGGHYYAVIKSFEDHQWYKFNDSSVHKIPDLKNPFRCNEVYFLLYKSLHESAAKPQQM